MHCFDNLINKHRVAGHHFILHWKFQKQNVYTRRARRPQSDDICTRHTALARRKTYSTAWVPGWWESSQCRGLESHDLSLEGKSLALHFVAIAHFAASINCTIVSQLQRTNQICPFFLSL